MWPQCRECLNAGDVGLIGGTWFCFVYHDILSQAKMQLAQLAPRAQIHARKIINFLQIEGYKFIRVKISGCLSIIS